MAKRADLEAASAAGIIPADAVAPLYDFLQRRLAESPAPVIAGEEDLRFIRNFHDVFLAIGIALFAIGLAVATGTFVAQSKPDSLLSGALTTAIVCLLSVGILWILAEFFARRRRLFLPAIALCLSITAFAAVAGVSLYTAIIGADVEGLQLTGEADWLNNVPLSARLAPAFVAASALAAVSAFYWRFRLPFSMGVVGVAAAALLASLVFASAPQAAWDLRNVLMLILGVVLFLAGVWFDSRDPERATRLSDNGFWLHVAAAPLVLNGALALLGGVNSQQLGSVDGDPNTVPRAIATLAIVFLLGLISLLINRRALIVSALVTTGIAIGLIMNATGLGAGALIAGTLVALGGFVLIIGASWHVIRRGLLGWINPQGRLARIFPPEQPA